MADGARSFSLRNIFITPYHSLRLLADVPPDEIRKEVLKALHKGRLSWDRLYELRLIESTLMKQLSAAPRQLAKPETGAIIIGLTGKGSQEVLRIHADRWVAFTTDHMYERLGWRDVTGKKTHGLSCRRKGHCVWYLRRLNISQRTRSYIDIGLKRFIEGNAGTEKRDSVTISAYKGETCEV